VTRAAEGAWRGSSTDLLLLSRSSLAPFRSTPRPISLEATIVPALIAARRVRAFDNGTRYFLDFGTPAGLKQLQRDQLVFS
jgi:NDP-sugar pyrophosphorylase family protein